MLILVHFALPTQPVYAGKDLAETSPILDNKRILFISSYSERFLTVPDQILGLQSIFHNHGAVIDIEYMDTKRLSSEENIKHFYDSLKYKLDHLPTYDALIVGDDTALQFAMVHQEELFYDLPIVFFGINDKDRARTADAMPNMTGSIEETSLQENLEIAKRFNPDAMKVIGIVDGTLTGKGDKKQLEDVKSAFPSLSFNTMNVSEYTFDEFGKQLEDIGDDTIVLFQSMNQDNTGKYMEMEDQFEFLGKHMKVPVYRASVGGVGEGLLGGRMIDYKTMGVQAAETVYQILTGTPIDTIKLNEQTPYYYIFDYDLIEKYKIEERLIPEGAVLYNKEITIFERYKRLFIILVIIFLFLGAITIVLVIDNIKRRKMQKELQESHEELIATYEELTASEEELKLQYDKIEEMANHDYLTMLPNRMHFVEQLSHELERKSYGAIMLLDIDNFKSINDTLGHVYGDHLLRMIADRFNKISDTKMFCARLGGDEFLILLRQVAEQKVINEYAMKIQRVFEEVFIYNDIENYINFSMGITQYPQDSDNLDQLIMNADAAMYKVKHSGKNSFIYYQEAMKQEIKTKKDIENILRQAIKDKGFYLRYQPQVDTKTGEIIGFEALLRLRDHNISPGLFIPIAEETGHIIQIGRWVAEEAIMQLDRWRKKGFTEKVVSINYSSKQLRDRNYIRFLKHLLQEYEICPEYVEIEITESIFLENDSQTKEFLQELKDTGFKLALDDFGTGFSSLNYLTFIPVDKIKLDKSINDKFLQSENTEVMDSIISLAHSLKLKITAEGIEEMDKYLQLKHGGCDYIQGYLFSKPLLADEIEHIYNLNLLERLEYNKYNLL
jgi:diguanylate cyclase (GGDEF)-like protein